jgi:hypothetical protein
MTTLRAWLNRLLPIVVAASAVNVLILLLRKSYDVHVGPLHLVAHGLFKPLLILNGAFLLTALFRNPSEPAPATARSLNARMPLIVLAALAAVVFALSVTVNPHDDEWNYRGLSSGYRTAEQLAHLFVSSQVNSWYRPLGFVSLWFDQAAYHRHVWAYHLQNILLHLGDVLLVFVLAMRLNLPKATAQWAAALYLVAAVTYEPVMWPSARFDLLAMLFTLAALIASIDFLRGRARTCLGIALLCYLLAVLSKESGYAFPVLIAVACCSMSDLRRRPQRLASLAVGVLMLTVCMLALRHIAVGGVGGYATADGSANLSFSAATVRSVLTRVMPMSLLSVNLSYPLPALLIAILGAFAALLACAAMAGASIAPRQRILALYALAGALPVAPILTWLDQSAQNARYLYMPAVFVSMLAAVALSNTRWPVILLSAFAFFNLCCGAYNVWVYEATYNYAGELARQVAADYAGQAGPFQLRVVGMPTDFDGVFFSRSEFEYRLQAKLQNATLIFEKDALCADRFCYQWQADRRTLVRFTR